MKKILDSFSFPSLIKSGKERFYTVIPTKLVSLISVIPSPHISVIPSEARNLSSVIARLNRAIPVLFSALLFLFVFNLSAVAEEFIPYPHKTGQILCYNASGGVIDCSGQGQDGTYRRGIAWPTTRWEGISATGTDIIANKPCIRDKLTGLIWQKNVSTATSTWSGAFTVISTVSSNNLCGWNDWRLPNITELSSLVDHSKSNQTTNLTGIGFAGVQSYVYWSSTTNASDPASARVVVMSSGYMSYGSKAGDFYVWPVRSGL